MSRAANGRPAVALVGVSHHTAPVEVRERFAFSDGEAAAVLGQLVGEQGVDEAVLLSTCNRTELYVHGPQPASLEAATALLARRAAEVAGAAGPSDRYLYRHGGQRAVRHLLRVVSSLDSMILGEAQIQGQVRGAYESAHSLDAPVTGPVLSRLFQLALRVGSTVRAETGLGAGAASVPSAAVELARKIFGSLRGRRALILGAGEMSRLALECLLGEGMDSVVVANRSEGRARELVERTGGAAIRFEDIAAQLPDTDLIATATAAPHPVLTEGMMRAALPKGARRSLCIIDMALPRDVEPGVGEIDNVFLYDLDDLQQIVDDSLERRRGEVPAAEAIIEDGVAEFRDWYLSRDVVPVIRALRAQAEMARAQEVERLLRRLPGMDAEQAAAAVDALSRQLVNKLLHAPTVRLREAAAGGEGEMARAARYLFELDEHTDGDEWPG